MVQSKSIQLNSDQHVWPACPALGILHYPPPSPLCTSICRKNTGCFCRLWYSHNTACHGHLRDQPFRCLTAQSPQPCKSRERNKNRTSILSYHVTPQKAEGKGEKRSSAQHCAHSNNHVTAINEWVLIPFNKIKKKHDKTWYTITDRARLNAQAWSFGAPPIRSRKKNAFKKTTCRDRIAYRTSFAGRQVSRYRYFHSLLLLSCYDCPIHLLSFPQVILYEGKKSKVLCLTACLAYLTVPPCARNVPHFGCGSCGSVPHRTRLELGGEFSGTRGTVPTSDKLAHQVSE